MADVINFVAMADLPNRLYELRRARGWSQQDVADRAHCSKMHVSGLERGKREFSLNMMRRLADVFGVSAADLLTADDNPQILSEDERRLLDTFRRAQPERQADIQRIAETFTPAEDRSRDAA